ncbi:hypothetical protein BY458DRAFT_438531 [Sporodiniella umbellata]|nr:hypothetical protein BY458DRAFT_438531 [Sporodiniella umbellata]
MQNKVTRSAAYQDQQYEKPERLRDSLDRTTAEYIVLDACARKSAEEVQEVLEALQQLNPDTIRDSNLRTPLHIACSRTDNLQIATEVAQLLIRAGSDVNNGLGDTDGLQPMHMAVLACNHQCVLMLLHEGWYFKMDNLLQHRKEQVEWASECAKQEYNDLLSITQVLVTHLASQHAQTFSSLIEPNNYGLSSSLFLSHRNEINAAIADVTDKLAMIDVSSDSVQESVDGLIDKVKKLSIKSYV